MSGPDFSIRSGLVNAAKRLAASDGTDLKRYEEALEAIGRLFSHTHGVDCDVTLTPNVEQARRIVEQAQEQTL